MKQTEKSKNNRFVFKNNGNPIFEWEQSLEEVNIYIDPPKGVCASDILCEIKSKHLKLGLKHASDKNIYFLNHELAHAVVVDESYWMLESGELNINLQKMKKGITWGNIFTGQDQLDPLAQEAEQKKIMLERFQEENPSFDFSNAEFNGAAPDARTFMGGVS